MTTATLKDVTEAKGVGSANALSAHIWYTGHPTIPHPTGGTPPGDDDTCTYADQPNFVPFFVETGGYIKSRRAHLFLDTLRGSQGSRSAADSRTQGYFRGPSPQRRRR
jgi:hypothetical protein